MTKPTPKPKGNQIAKIEPAKLPANLAPPTTAAPGTPPRPKWSVGKPLSLGIISVVILLGGFFGWATVYELSGAIISSGRIEVESNRQVIQHPDGGVVAKILVKEGDTVAQGDLLIQLEGTLLQSQLSAADGQFYETLARASRLEAERDLADTVTFDPELLAAVGGGTDVQDLMDGQVRLFEARVQTLKREVEQLGRKRDQIASQITGIDAQIVAMQTQLRLIKQELENQQSLLDRGLAQISRVLALQREEASIAGQIGALTASKAQAGEQMIEIDIQVAKLTNQRQEDAISQMRDLSASELQLREQRRSLQERMSRLDIRSPVSGIIYGMQVFAERSVVRPADAVMFIIPQDRPLIIAAQVSPLHVDQVYVGQEVNLRFSTFNSRTTPELIGHVVQVSADAFADENAGQYYRAQLRIDEGELDRLPDGITLVPGMPVEAFFRTEDRTPLEYLLKPMTDYFRRAFRES